ncbi:uncharacterized protein LOC129756925 isoform X2 [Uranotaenia lowii]|nr:uncharacterized protein LOC129756925 isoform X2 [Uranotaenia lowii]
MSFLRNIRNNLKSSSDNHRGGNSKTRPFSANQEPIYGATSIYGAADRRNSASNGRRGSSSNNTTIRRDQDRSGRYGKENPAPIVVYVDKYETVKKPAGILRKNTFTKGDPQQQYYDRHHQHDEVDSGGDRQQLKRSNGTSGDREERGGNAISRSDTFTIAESEDEQRTKNTSTFTRKKSKDKTPDRTTTKGKGKNSTSEKLPVVIDSGTYRKKSIKTSKPVQKVESFIKRFEKSLFKNDSKKNGRKDSNSSQGSYVPTFRDIGINCKLDEEERSSTIRGRKKRGSRDSLLEQHHQEHSSSSQRSYRDRSTTPQIKRRERSSSPTKKYATFDRKDRGVSPIAPERSKTRAKDRSVSPFETLELKSKSVDNDYLKARQKEIEMGYSTVNKRPSADRNNKSILVNSSRTERYDPDKGHSYTVTTSTHRVEFDRPSAQFRSDTYNTLKEEYEQANRKPVGIASPRLNADRPLLGRSPSPMSKQRKDSAELPKYTFGTNLQERRSRFQEFQKSFTKIDDNSSAEVCYQQSFFVPI